MKSRFNPLFKKPEAAAAIYIRALLPWIDSRGWLGTSGSQSGGLGIESEVPVIAQTERFFRPVRSGAAIIRIPVVAKLWFCRSEGTEVALISPRDDRGRGNSWPRKRFDPDPSCGVECTLL